MPRRTGTPRRNDAPVWWSIATSSTTSSGDSSTAHARGAAERPPFDNPQCWFLSNDQIKQAADTINSIAGRQRLLFHSLFTPKQPGWLDEVDRCIATVQPTSWKGYTSATRWRPHQISVAAGRRTLMGPFYDKIAKAGITTVCIHKGLLPADCATSIQAVPGAMPTSTTLARRRSNGRRSTS
jgi:hypothetical protein